VHSISSVSNLLFSTTVSVVVTVVVVSLFCDCNRDGVAVVKVNERFTDQTPPSTATAGNANANGSAAADAATNDADAAAGSMTASSALVPTIHVDEPDSEPSSDDDHHDLHVDTGKRAVTHSVSQPAAVNQLR